MPLMVPQSEWLMPVVCDKKFQKLTHTNFKEVCLIEDAARIKLYSSHNDDFRRLNKLLDRCLEHVVANEGWRSAMGFLRSLRSLSDSYRGLEVCWTDLTAIPMWGALFEEGWAGQKVHHFCAWQQGPGKPPSIHPVNRAEL